MPIAEPGRGLESIDCVGGTAKSYSLAAVNQAGALSLCERSGEVTRTVHTLVSRTMRFQFPKEERIAKLRSAAVQVLNRRLAGIDHIGEYSRIAIDMPHARHLVTIGLRTEQEALLGFWVAQRDYEQGDYSSARQLQEQVLATRRQLLGKQHLDTLVAMNNLAQTLSAQGDLAQARQLQEQVLAARRQLLGGEPTMVFMNNFAQTVKAQGALAGARMILGQVLRKLFGTKAVVRGSVHQS